MRFPLAVPALAALAAALPAPQEIDLDMVLAMPDPTYTTTASSVTYDATSLAAQATEAITSVSVDISELATATAAVAKRNNAKRAACAAQPTGVLDYYIRSPDDSASAFASNSAFAALASAAPVPSGYTNTFTNLNASNK